MKIRIRSAIPKRERYARLGIHHGGRQTDSIERAATAAEIDCFAEAARAIQHRRTDVCAVRAQARIIGCRGAAGFIQLPQTAEAGRDVLPLSDGTDDQYDSSKAQRLERDVTAMVLSWSRCHMRGHVLSTKALRSCGTL